MRKITFFFFLAVAFLASPVLAQRTVVVERQTTIPLPGGGVENTRTSETMHRLPTTEKVERISHSTGPLVVGVIGIWQREKTNRQVSKDTNDTLENIAREREQTERDRIAVERDRISMENERAMNERAVALERDRLRTAVEIAEIAARGNGRVVNASAGETMVSGSAVPNTVVQISVTGRRIPRSSGCTGCSGPIVR